MEGTLVYQVSLNTRKGTSTNKKSIKLPLETMNLQKNKIRRLGFTKSLHIFRGGDSHAPPTLLLSNIGKQATFEPGHKKRDFLWFPVCGVFKHECAVPLFGLQTHAVFV